MSKLLGREYPQEQRDNMSKASLGKPKSAEHKAALSAARIAAGSGWKMKSITINGLEYYNISDARSKLGISYYELQKLLKKELSK
jgi:hypothetical protein